jgi:hypothetical protein
LAAPKVLAGWLVRSALDGGAAAEKSWEQLVALLLLV